MDRSEAGIPGECPGCKTPAACRVHEECLAPPPPAEQASGEFDSWWNASKYRQVVYSGPSHRQIALDGWNAALSQRPVVGETAWRDAFIAERARRYRSEGMKIEQARIHAETDAQVITANALAPQQPTGEEG